MGIDLDFDLFSDSESSSEFEGMKFFFFVFDGESEGKRGWQKLKVVLEGVGVLVQGSFLELGWFVVLSFFGEVEFGVYVLDKEFELGGQEEGEWDGFCGLGNGCVDRKEVEIELQNSELLGVIVGEFLDQSMEEEEEEDMDEDDYFIYLEEILVCVYIDYYVKYDCYFNKEIEEVLDICKIVLEFKSKVLVDVVIIFSGLYLINFLIEKMWEYYYVMVLGVKIFIWLVLSFDVFDRVMYLIVV